MINKLTLLAHWSVRQKLRHVSLVQFSSVTSLCTRLNVYSKCTSSCTDIRGPIYRIRTILRHYSHLRSS